MNSKQILASIREADNDSAALEVIEAAMASASLHTGREQWFKMTELIDTEHRLVDLGGEPGEGQPPPRPVYSAGRYFDADGELMLVAAQVDMSGMPFSILNQARQVLQAQALAPVLMVPPELRMMRFKPISNREAERVKARLKQQRMEAQRLTDEVRAEIKRGGSDDGERKLKLVT
jgi:hypothetical protein